MAAVLQTEGQRTNRKRGSDWGAGLASRCSDPSHSCFTRPPSTI